VSPNTKQLIKLNTQPTSKFTASPKKISERPSRKVKFADFEYMDNSEIEAELSREERQSMDRVTARKFEVEARIKRNLERRLAREARSGSDNPLPKRQETHPQKKTVKIVAEPVPIKNKQTRVQRKDYAKYDDDSEEEFYESSLKRQKIDCSVVPAVEKKTFNRPKSSAVDSQGEN